MKVLVLVSLLVLPAHADWQQTSNLPEPLATPLAGDPMGVTIHRLANGLTVYLSPNKQDPRITAWIAVRAGGAQDPADSTGMAHYLEHMLFKGSHKLGTLNYEAEKPYLQKASDLYDKLFATNDPAKRKEIYAEIDKQNQAAAQYAVPNEMPKAYKALGINAVNAFTSSERTVYICSIPKNRLAAWAKLEGDRFKSPVFRLFQTEIETVYEEKNRSLDNPQRILSEAIYTTLYPGHSYGRTILGSVQHLKNPSLAKMYAFYARYYVPNNMAVVLSGDFDREAALATIESEFGSWQPRDLGAKVAAPIKEIRGIKRVEVTYESEEQVNVVYPTVDQKHPDNYALMVLDMLADNAEAGLINLRLNQAQKLKRAGSYPDMRNEAGSWNMYGTPKQGQTLAEVEALLLEIVEALKAGEFSQQDIAAIVRDFEIAEKRRLESNSKRANNITASFISYRPWSEHMARVSRLRAVTKDDVVRVAKKYLGGNRVVAMRRKGQPKIPSMTKPKFTKVALDASRESLFFKEVVSMPADEIQPRWLQSGRDYQIKKIPSGTLYRAPNPMNDVFDLTFRFERGRKAERNLCEAISLLEKAGAGDEDADVLKKRFYAMGLTWRMWCNEDSSGVALSGLEETLPEALDLLRHRLAAPHLAKDTLKKLIEIKLTAHKDNKINPSYVNYALSEYAERGRKSSVLSQLTDEELKRLMQADLVRLINTLFDYRRKVSYVGTRSAEELAKLLLVEGKTYTHTKRRERRTYRKPKSAKIFFTHRDMVQAKVGMFAADGVYNESAWNDHRYYTTYMGGSMSAVIFQEIREARSLAYAAGGGYRAGLRKGDENRLYGYVGTQADKTIEATELLRSLLAKMPVSEKRFTDAKKAIEQDYRTNPTRFRAIPHTIIGWEYRGIKKDPRPRRLKKAQSYTLKDLERFAEPFGKKPMVIHALGSRDRVDIEALKKLGVFVEKSIDELFPY
jgi:predicted Zn-dependent peptidase